MTPLLLCITAYLLGAIPVGYLMGKFLRGIDIRQHGSGNPGATNAFRVLGAGPGAVTFLLDTLKGLLPVLAAVRMGSSEATAVAVGMSAIAGHMYTIFLRFQGGKGVATSAGVFAALLPGPAGLALAAFAAVFGATGYVSLGSIVAAIVLPLSALLMDASPLRLFCALTIGAFIIYKHRPNIRRLIDGTENKIRFHRKRS